MASNQFLNNSHSMSGSVSDKSSESVGYVVQNFEYDDAMLAEHRNKIQALGDPNEILPATLEQESHYIIPLGELCVVSHLTYVCTIKDHYYVFSYHN